jgi:hypothetical protein
LLAPAYPKVTILPDTQIKAVTIVVSHAVSIATNATDRQPIAFRLMTEASALQSLPKVAEAIPYGHAQRARGSPIG